MPKADTAAERQGCSVAAGRSPEEHLLFEGRAVGVRRVAAQIIDKRQVLVDVCRRPATEEAIE